MQYVQDNDEMYPFGAKGDIYGRGWAGMIYPYVKSINVYNCPSDPYAYPGNISYGYNMNFVYTPANSNAYDRGIGGIASQLTAPASTVLVFETQGYTNQGINILNESNGILNFPFTSGAGTGLGSFYTFSAYATGVFSDYSFQGTPIDITSNAQLQAASTNGQTGFYFLTGRHTGGSNYIFADGHVKWLLPSAVSAGNSPWPVSTTAKSQSFYGAAMLAAGTACTNDPLCPSGHCTATFSPY